MSHNYSSLLLWYEGSHRLYVTNGLNSVPVKLYLQEQAVSCIWIMGHHLLTLALVTEGGLVAHNIILFTPCSEQALGADILILSPCSSCQLKAPICLPASHLLFPDLANASGVVLPNTVATSHI